MNGSAESADIADSTAFAARFGVSRETLEKLNLYESALRQWQRAINLVAPATLPQLWHRHFADSAQLAALLPAGPLSVIDLGSGAGFPGLVISIMRAEQGLTRVILVESDGRKCAFLREVARLTGAPVEILSTRIENPKTQSSIGTVDVVTARALAPLDRLLGMAAPYMNPRSIGLFLKGQDAQAEVQVARVRWSFECSLVQSVTDPRASITFVRHLDANLAPKGRVEP